LVGNISLSRINILPIYTVKISLQDALLIL